MVDLFFFVAWKGKKMKVERRMHSYKLGYVRHISPRTWQGKCNLQRARLAPEAQTERRWIAQG